MPKSIDLERYYTKFNISCNNHPDLTVYIRADNLTSYLPRSGICPSCGDYASIKKEGVFSLKITDLSNYQDGKKSHPWMRRDNILMTTILYLLKCAECKERPLIKPVSAQWKEKPEIIGCPVCGSEEYEVEKFDVELNLTPIDIFKT